ncbi:MAG: CoA transferase, partial [Proteobacteria bacterium]|nr:CoA transferase [Pseudomonadota bacterium]
PVSDGWIFLGANPRQRADLSQIDALSDIASPENVALEDDALAALLAGRLSKNTGDYWVNRLRSVGVGAAKIQNLKDIRQQSLVKEGEDRIDLTGRSILFVRHENHPMGRRVDLAAPNWIRFKRSATLATGPAPKFGADTRAILRDHGYSPAEIDALIAKGVAAVSWSNTEQYLPE